MIKSRNTAVFALIGAAAASLMAPHPVRAQAEPAEAAFRPPAVPLVTSDPYLSVWSEADHLNDKNTQHWTHHEQSLVSLIRVDGKAYRLMGDDPDTTPALPQTGLQVLPTRSIYQFENEAVHVTMTFMTPALPHDLDILTRPVTYITWDVRSMDGKTHSVSVYDSTSSELAVNEPKQKVTWLRQSMGPLTALSVGTVDQTLFDPAGDDTRIDWGYAYTAAPSSQAKGAIGGDQALLTDFIENGTLPAKDDASTPRATDDDQPVLALAFDLGSVGTKPVSRHAMVAYDEIYSIKFFGQRLRPYWRRNGATPSTLLQAAEQDYPSLVQRCTQFDNQLMADMTTEGGMRYAKICALAYRQCLAANGIAADKNGQPLMFTKENTSNGDIATVDVIFPQDPMMILLSPTLAKASIVPVLIYGSSPRWRFPNAPHDLGTYPVARGTDDGGEQMPVEESGNIIIICDAIAQEEGNANWVTPWWKNLSQWAQYLEQYGQDPEDQLCTDDFMGHLAHNSNLSIKAIIALAAYADLCKMRGEKANATKYHDLAVGFAKHWMEAAADGNHYRLAFDKPNTWSQKYNLVWDKLLGLNVFPPQVASAEVAYYKSVLQPYGVPLDSRTHLTKTDWSFWCATLADNQTDFETIVSPAYDYLNATTTRDPISDSYETDNIRSGGMHARPVVGGLFIKMLDDRSMWQKWSKGDKVKAAGWAALPPPPTITSVIATSQVTPQTWHYTTDKPAENWITTGFDDSAWQKGTAGFGTDGTPGLVKHTTWNTDDIWLRRTITIPAGITTSDLQFIVYHDEDVQVYVNGILATSEAGYNGAYVPLPINPPALALLKPGTTVTLAVHCHQTTGGQGVDVGLAHVIQH
jgi:hypothetical protein